MANAEQLLHEAQFAFQSISFGETPDNKRNASRASSLSRKIIRKYPGSMEAGEAHAILRRLGEEAYSSKLAIRHVHTPETAGRETRSPSPSALPSASPTPTKTRSRLSSSSSSSSRSPSAELRKQRTFTVDDGVETLDWAGLIKWIFTVPKAVLGLIMFGGIFLFGILGPFLFLPLIAFIFLTGPFRKSLKQEQRQAMNEFIQRVNAYVANER